MTVTLVTPRPCMMASPRGSPLSPRSTRMATASPSACPGVAGGPTASPSLPLPSPSLLGVTGGLSWPPSSLTPTSGAEASQSLLPVGGHRHIPRPDVERQRADPLLSAHSCQPALRPFGRMAGRHGRVMCTVATGPRTVAWQMMTTTQWPCERP